MSKTDISLPQVTSSAVMTFPQPPLKNVEEYLRAYTGYAYTAISSIAQEVASIDLHLFKTVYVKGQPESTEIYEHEALSAIHYVNPLMTFYDMIEATQIYLELVGEAFWVVLKVGNKPKEFWLLRPDWVSVVADLQKVIGGYIYHPGGGAEKVVIPTENMIHFKYFHPMNPYRGKGSIQAAALPLDIHTFAQEYNRNFFFNSAIPSLVFTSDKPLSEAVVKKFINQWQASFGGRAKSNKVAFLGNGMKMDTISIGGKDMDFTEQQRMMRDDVLAIFKVPKTVLGLTDDVNRANAESTTRAFMERVVTPRMKKLVGTLNEFFLPMYGENALFFDFTDPAPEDTEMKLKRYENALKYGWMTPNEVRAEENMESVEGGDDLPKPSINPFGGTSGKPTEQVPAEEVPLAGKESIGLPSILQKVFGKKEVIRVIQKGRERILKGKPFKHMMGIPPKRPEVLQRESLSKDLAPKIAKVIGQLLSMKDNDKVGVKKLVKEKNNDSLWTEEKKVAYWRQFIEHTDKYDAELRNVVVSIFNEQEHMVMDLIDNSVKYWRKDLRKGKAGSAVPSVVDMDALWKSTWVQVVREIYYEQGMSVLDFLGVGGTIDLTSRTAVEYLRRYGGVLIKEIDETTLDQLRKTLAEGFDLGEGVDKLKVRVRGIFKEATTRRAVMIARTESLKASNAATVEAYRQSGVVEAKEWLTERDDRTCPFCEELDGKVISLNDDYFKQGDTFTVSGQTMSFDFSDVGEPPAHSQCRCTTIPVLIKS